MMEPDNPKTEKLKNILGDMGSVLIALSGGVDSALLLHVASRILKENVKAITFISQIFPKDDLIRAENLTKILKIRLFQVDFGSTAQGRSGHQI